MNFHLLFEQSGTFKNVLKANGHKAFDYDVLNDYGETDFVIDLFEEIDKEYDNIINNTATETIFSKMSSDKDFIIAFFPCTYFCDSNQLQFKLYNAGKRLPFNLNNCKRLIERNNIRARYFELYLKFCFICKHKGIRTIIENPASGGKNNYLVLFSPIDVSWHEKDRSLFGDFYKKSTNYFSINFVMKESFIFYQKNYYTKNILDCVGMSERSLMSKEYAECFYKRFLKEIV